MERKVERKKATLNFMLKIAEHKIKAYKLSDTPEEYIKKAKEK